jgi:hypothetical protein
MIHDFKQDMPEMVHKAVTDAWDAHDGINEAALEKVLEEIFARNFERYFGSQQVKLAISLKEGDRPPEYAPATTWPTTAEKLQSSVAHLESRCQSGTLYPYDEKYSIAVHADIAFALENWWNDDQQVCLWIQGQDTSSLSSLIGEMNAMALSEKISVAAHVCNEISFDGDLFTPTELVINLLYSLIYQLIHNLPADFSGAIDFDPETIAKLDGTLASLAPAMAIFRHLLSIMSSPVLILVDGFNLLDCGDDEKLQTQVKILLEGLKAPIEATGKVKKTLFYTSEPSMILLNELEPENIFDASQLDGSEGVFAFNS